MDLFEDESMGGKGKKRATYPKNNISDQLPDGLKGRIVSFLSPKDGAKTCLLSHAWEKIWRNHVTKLNFIRMDDFIHEENPNLVDRIQREKENFISYVDKALKFLERHGHDHNLETFSITCAVLGFDVRKDIDGWLDFAFERKVKELELDFIWSWEAVKADYVVNWKKITTPAISNNLTSLTLKYVTVDVELVRSVLLGNGFECLQKLVVDGNSPTTDVSTELKCKRQLQQHHSLRHLTFGGLFGLEAIELIGIDQIITLEIQIAPYFVLDGFTALRRLTILLAANGTPLRLCKIAHLFPQLATLILRPLVAIVNDNEDFLAVMKGFTKLTTLDITFDGDEALQFMLQALKEFPVLAAFKIKVSLRTHSDDVVHCDEYKRFVVQCDTNLPNLKFFQFTGFEGSLRDVDFFCNVVARRPNLKSIVFFLHSTGERGQLISKLLYRIRDDLIPEEVEVLLEFPKQLV